MKKTVFSNCAFFVLFFGLITCFYHPAQAQYRYRKDVAKEQKERSFQEWERRQPKVRIEAVKSAIDQSKLVNGTRGKSARLKRKENKLRQRIK